mmetsp:Transcript_95322/g.296796  ORF Transcript_95322/g.296796 Transcript_95322/m.296796 type:complete len:206 (-) Transcript_95322:61-678(-)
MTSSRGISSLFFVATWEPLPWPCALSSLSFAGGCSFRPLPSATIISSSAIVNRSCNEALARGPSDCCSAAAVPAATRPTVPRGPGPGLSFGGTCLGAAPGCWTCTHGCCHCLPCCCHCAREGVAQARCCCWPRFGNTRIQTPKSSLSPMAKRRAPGEPSWNMCSRTAPRTVSSVKPSFLPHTRISSLRPMQPLSSTWRPAGRFCA